METIPACRVCASKNVTGFFDLGKQPLANSLPASVEEKEESYSLSLGFCNGCSLVQLNETIDPEKLFSEYVWVTGTSKTANEYAQKFYEETMRRVGGEKKGYVIEVASNDGTFLKPFQSGGWEVLGIDPAKNICDMAVSAGVPTDCVFFGEAAARATVEKNNKKADVIFARNVLPHVANTIDFVRGLAAAVADDGTVIIEAHNASIILEELHYDSIYHEHLCYFTFKTLERLLNDSGLFIFDISKSPISGGSMVVYAKKKKIPESSSVGDMRQIEEVSGVNTLEKWEDFARRATSHKEKLILLLGQAKQEGKVVVGWGASARSSTLLNFCGIDSKVISAIVDLNPLKQGRFTAGTLIPIKTAEEVMAMHPECLILLAWNFTDEIMDMLKNKFGYKGRVIIPLPRDSRVVEL